LNDRGVFNLKERSTPVSEEPISSLGQRMIEDMTARNLMEKTPTITSATSGRSWHS
jgi:hypothetical protein